MAIRTTRGPLGAGRFMSFSPYGITVLSVVVWAMASAPALADAGFCTNTAGLQLRACTSESRDDFYIAHTICLNTSDAEERSECRSDAYAELHEASILCKQQRAARRDLCDAIGEARYEPDFDPALFDDDFANLTNPNPYFPLGIGNRWVFESEDETTTIEVQDKTKSIAGVTCIVVNDLVAEDGVPLEDTDDWFGQRKDGTVDYCGESVQDFEVFDGDQPQEPELVEIEGSFKAGRDGDKSGTLFPGNPEVGKTFRQEWSPSNAEDAAIVLSTTYQYGDGELDEHVPEDLAELMCSASPCVVIGEFSPIEPGTFERKYFARGVGKFLEVDTESGEISQLVECNHDAKCGGL